MTKNRFVVKKKNANERSSGYEQNHIFRINIVNDHHCIIQVQHRTYATDLKVDNRNAEETFYILTVCIIMYKSFNNNILVFLEFHLYKLNIIFFYNHL